MKTTKLAEDALMSIVCDACRIYRHELLVYPETARTPEKFARDYTLHLTAGLEFKESDEGENKEGRREKEDS